MAKKKKSNPYVRTEQVHVYIWGKYVGAVALDPSLGYYVFAYDKSFGRSGIEIAPLHTPLNDKGIELRIKNFSQFPRRSFCLGNFT